MGTNLWSLALWSRAGSPTWFRRDRIELLWRDFLFIMLSDAASEWNTTLTLRLSICPHA